MRHKIDGRQLGRDTGARKALFKNLVTSLFEHDKIVTTHAKAKEARRVAEKLITKAKKNSIHAVIFTFRKLGSLLQERGISESYLKRQRRQGVGVLSAVRVGNLLVLVQSLMPNFLM